MISSLLVICPGGNIESMRSPDRLTLLRVSDVVTDLGMEYRVAAVPRESLVKQDALLPLGGA